MLQSLLKDEEKSVDAFHIRDAEIKEILEIRQHQIDNPLLKFSIFDPLRNEAARKLRLQRVSCDDSGFILIYFTSQKKSFHSSSK